MLNKIPGRVYLFVAILIFAASNSVTRQLIELGENYLIDGRNPISFCNVLFVGNLCALLALVTIYVGTVVFFAVVIKLFGVSHFTDVFAPVLWQWMLVYGVVIVVGGQLSWFQGLKRTKAADVSLASSFSPLAGILFAYLILREVPTSAQYIGGAVIILGIIFNQVGVIKQNQLQAANKQKTWHKELDHDVGFKGI